MFSPLQILSGEKPSPGPQLDVVLQVILALASRLGWLVLFLLVLVEGGLRLHLLVSGVGLAHLPTLVLPMVGAQWILRDWTEGPIAPFGVRPQFYRTFPPTLLIVFPRFPTRCPLELL
jgi:hypothetical protein